MFSWEIKLQERPHIQVVCKNVKQTSQHELTKRCVHEYTIYDYKSKPLRWKQRLAETEAIS